jgi:hypothetical protein
MRSLSNLIPDRAKKAVHVHEHVHVNVDVDVAVHVHVVGCCVSGI